MCRTGVRTSNPCLAETIDKPFVLVEDPQKKAERNGGERQSNHETNNPADFPHGADLERCNLVVVSFRNVNSVELLEHLLITNHGVDNVLALVGHEHLDVEGTSVVLLLGNVDAGVLLLRVEIYRKRVEAGGRDSKKSSEKVYVP